MWEQLLQTAQAGAVALGMTFLDGTNIRAHQKAAPFILVLASKKEEGDVGELRDPVDREEQEELALRQAQLADIDVDVADPGLGEALALRGLLVIPRQTSVAVARQAAVQRTMGEPGDLLAQGAQDVIEPQQGAAPELDDDGFFRA